MPIAAHSESRLLASLHADDRARLEGSLDQVFLCHGAVLATRHEPIEHVYFPIDALGSTVIELEEGDSVEVGVIGTEGMSGLSLLYGQTLSMATVVAQIAGNAYRMSATAFLRDVVERGGAPYRRLLGYANAFGEMMAQGAACNATHSVEQRCARWILQAHDRVPSDTLPLTHEYLGIMLGVRRASVSAAANLLRLAGAIHYGRGDVKVLDRDKLLEAACTCYRAMDATMAPFLR